jgi:O-antigen/teichoic acid export membrane protein
MAEKPYRTAWWLGLTFLSLSGLAFMIVIYRFHLDYLFFPVIVYGYASFGACSYLTGYSARESHGRSYLSILYEVLTIVLGLMVVILADETHLAAIGFFAAFVVFLVFLALGLLRKP